MNIIDDAIDEIDATSSSSTDGKWLEYLTAKVAPHLKEWDIDLAWPWTDWEEREERFPGTTNQDIGIDVVAERRSDGELIAIQCKSRKLNAEGRGSDITKREADSFLSSSAERIWAERWIVTNGNAKLSSNIEQTLSMSPKPLKLVNIHADLASQNQITQIAEDCAHCQSDPDPETAVQTKSCMQDEAVETSVRILREHERSESGGLPVGQARGKIILPCGTGKTRISLRIVEKLTSPGELAVVLCPSIALVAQIRREYLQHATVPIRALAVCSDETAGYNPKREDTIDLSNNPTADNSNFSASEIKGKVTTNAAEISRWISNGKGGDALSVVFGTYQSGNRVATALQTSKTTANILIADEAHRTAGFRRKASKSEKAKNDERQIRNFTLCHDQEAFPASFRVYQTATPKIFDIKPRRSAKRQDWIVRSMDDEKVFGVELYRKSYPESVRNGWLADYRIIAIGVNDPEAYEQARLMATGSELTGRQAITSAQALRGLVFALAMSGATQGGEDGSLAINSCIAFMNSVAKSKEFARHLQTEPVRNWVNNWLKKNAKGQRAKKFSLEHLDATSNVAARDNAKTRLAEASEESPYGILNVGIFGEGTDSPSLNAVAFLEARKSPIDVIQAVGRAMRTAPKKSLGYIICPILIPPESKAEEFLATSDMDEGWKELGQILQALRAHDQRIEDELSELMAFYLPQEPEITHTLTAVVNQDSSRVQYRQHSGKPGAASVAVERVLNRESTLSVEFDPVVDPPVDHGHNDLLNAGLPSGEIEPTQIITGKKNNDGSIEMRVDTVVREKPDRYGNPGAVDVEKTKAKAKKMINEGEGVRMETPSEKRKKQRERRTSDEIANQGAMQMIMLSRLGEYADAIKVNLLKKSGLSDNRVQRDLNLLETGINEAAFHLQSDDLVEALNRHFGLDNLNEASLKEQADGCKTAALLLMNAAMLHQRISAGRWLSGISPLSAVKNDPNVVRRVTREWNQILSHDFRPVVQPALEAIYEIENTGKTAGLERALRHITAEAERIAETYADMGADHAGPLFNSVMGNQASDGAFFTRPVAASIAARLTLDACGERDWTLPETWQAHKTVDLACGSGTLLAAMLTDMKRRAAGQGADKARITQLQKLAVEEVIKGLDINPVSLQLAASQLTTGNQDIRYRQMGLHLMPYGPNQHDQTRVSAGTLELLAQKAIVSRDGELDIRDDSVASRGVWDSGDDIELEDAVDAAQDARIVIMNPPFTRRAKMGEKFPQSTKTQLQRRIDTLQRYLVNNDETLEGFADKTTARPLFVALANSCLSEDGEAVMSMVHPIIALTAASGRQERRMLARHHHIHTIVTCHQPGNINLSQGTGMNESILVFKRCDGAKPPTRIIQLDRMPSDEIDVEHLHNCILECSHGQMANGWGEVSEWPADLIESGDWTAAIWRSPDLAEAAARFAYHREMKMMKDYEISLHQTGRELTGSHKRAEDNTNDAFPVLDSGGQDGQFRIESQPESIWVTKTPDKTRLQGNSAKYPETDRILKKSGYGLFTFRQNNNSARLTAVAGNRKYVGNGWMPASGLSEKEAKATAVFMNSTAGRIQLMRNTGMTLTYPNYPPAAYSNIRIPDIKDGRILDILADCWERTKDMIVPQFRDGECEVRRLWDEAVAVAMGWDGDELSQLRHLLHREPHVHGLGYNQFSDEIED